MRHLRLVFSLAAALALGLGACELQRPGTADATALPSIAYAPYVSAFTHGPVRRQEAIRVQFPGKSVGAVADSAAEAGLLTFRPAIAGSLRWERDRLLVFTPDEPLAPGTQYTATLQLARLNPEVPDSLARFTFGFETYAQGLVLGEARVRPDPTDPSPLVRQVAGSVTTYDYAAPDDVEQTLEATQEGRALDIAWTHADRGRRHDFIVDGVRRGPAASEVVLRLRGDALDVALDTAAAVAVTSSNAFSVTGLEVEQESDQLVTVFFSDPVDDRQDLTGLIHLADGTELRLVAQGNAVLAYPLSRRSGSHELVVEGSLRSSAGATLDSTSRHRVAFTDLKPAVELTGRGTIVPSSTGAVFPFRAVALNSVEVTIVQIYADNVLQFLQDNNLGSQYQLTRVGRPVYSGRVPLRADGPVDYLEWNHFAIDLAELIAVDPGAIYRVQLDFGPGNSEYPCDTPLAEEIAGADPQARFASYNALGYYYDYYNDDETQYYFRGDGGDDPCQRAYYTYRRTSRNFLASDIGLLAKSGAGGQLLVVATELTDATPIAGLEVELYNIQQRVVASAKTGPNGVAVFDPPYQPFAAVARRGTERAYLRLDEANALNTSTFDVRGERVADGARGMIYGERGVWRPGDSIYLSLILERSDAEREAGVPVVFELYNPAGQRVEQRAVVESAPGMYDLRTATDRDAPTGPWRATVRAGATTITETVRVETVMPNRLKVALDFAGDPVPLHDATAFGLEARWLFGAPAGALEADVAYSASPLASLTGLAGFERYEGYSFRDGSRGFSVSDQGLFDGELGADGTATVDFGIDDLSALPGMLRARFTTRVFEGTGAFSTVVESATLSPFASYVGLRPPEAKDYYGLSADEPADFDLVVLDEEGAPVARERLDVEIYDIDWSYWWERDRDNSLATYVSNRAQHIALEDRVAAPGGRATYRADLSALSYGRKLIRVVDPVSGHAATQTFYLADPRWAYDASSRPGGAELLAFELNKETYVAGEQIVASLPAFPGGRAFVSVENGEGLLSYRWVEGREVPQEVALDTEPGMAPNAYVAVSLIQPHAQTANDQPIRLYGVQPFTFSDPGRRLSPKLELPTELAPEEAFSVTVREAEGRAMSYTLAVVEEGLLDITSFDTPDPYERFNRRVALGVRTWDLYDHVLGAFTGQLAGLLAIGGDEDTGEQADPRANRFRPVVKYVGPFRLAPGATATHAFDMPNYVGSVRAMVVATDGGGAYGAAEETRPVKRPLMVLATLPRVLGPGEEVSLPVTVFAMDDAISEVKLRVEGLELLSADETSASVRFETTGEQVAYFTLRAPEQLGVARVRVVAEGAGFRASDEIELDVRAPNTEVVEADRAVVEPGETWATAYAAPGMAGTNSGQLEVSTALPLNLEQRLGYLTRYPHGCIEQTVSGAFPQLYLGDLTALTPARAATVQRNVRAAIRKLSRFAIGDGRFRYWPSRRSDYTAWGSIYAGHFLYAAKAQGYRVPEAMLAEWQRAERRAANAWTPNRTNAYAYETPVTQAYRLYALALAERPQLGAMNRLRGQEALPPVARDFLAAAYALAGQRDAARDLVAATSVERTDDEPDHRRYSYGSATRDEAVALYVQTLLGNRAEAFALAEKLSGKLSSARWYSTQSTAWSLLAMQRFLEDDDANQPGRYTYVLDGDAREETQGEIVRITKLRPPAPAAGQFAITNTGERALYVRLVRRGTPSASQQLAESENLRMRVRYTDLGGTAIDPATIEQGRDFLAVATITHAGTRGDYEHLAFTQVFPSGWEIRNERLEGAALPAGLNYQDIRDDRVLSYFDLARGKSLTVTTQLNAAYAGRYYLPDRYCQAMYDNDVRARVPGRWVTVAEQ